MRQTSKDAYDKIRSNGLLKSLNLNIYDWLFHNGPATSREILNGVGFIRDVGVVSSSIAKLVRQNVVKDVAVVRCTTTGNAVTQWDVTENLPARELRHKRERCPMCNAVVRKKGNGEC